MHAVLCCNAQLTARSSAEKYDDDAVYYLFGEEIYMYNIRFEIKRPSCVPVFSCGMYTEYI